MKINLKTEIKTQLKNWKEEYELFHDAFSHSEGKDQELALIGDKVIDLILYRGLYNVVRVEDLDLGNDIKFEIKYRPFSKGEMDTKRQMYFSRENEAIIFDELELEDMLIAQHQDLTVNVKHAVFEAIFGALFLLFDLEQTTEFLKKISLLMDYRELKDVL